MAAFERATGFYMLDRSVGPVTVCASAYTGQLLRAGANGICASDLLSDFDGENPNGVWTLTVHDDLGSDSGMLIDWSLGIATN